MKWVNSCNGNSHDNSIINTDTIITTYYKFIAESDSETVLKIGQNLVPLLAR